MLHILKIRCEKAAQECPDKASDIWDVFELAADEISDGESEEHKCSLADKSLDELGV